MKMVELTRGNLLKSDAKAIIGILRSNQDMFSWGWAKANFLFITAAAVGDRGTGRYFLSRMRVTMISTGRGQAKADRQKRGRRGKGTDILLSTKKRFPFVICNVPYYSKDMLKSFKDNRTEKINCDWRIYPRRCFERV